MAEHSAVNRRVVGSSPTCGANTLKAAGKTPAAFSFCQADLLPFPSGDLVDRVLILSHQ
jgi:hypothetical protein